MMIKELETVVDVESNQDYQINKIQNEDLSFTKDMQPKDTNLIDSLNNNYDESDCDIFDDYFEKQDQNINLKNDTNDQS